jgi:hypothetical protein
MDFIQEHDIDSKKFVEILPSIETPFNDGKIHNNNTSKNELAKEIRNCKTRTLNNKQIYGHIKNFLTKINTGREVTKYILQENEITHIKYTGGGFFSEHEDHLYNKSNFLDEYVLIVCISPTLEPEEGGRTILKLNKHYSVKSSASCTFDRCLLFRKDIPHSGEELTNGSIKEILVFNVWAVPIEIDRILSVSFKDDSRTILLDVKRITSNKENHLKIYLDSWLEKKDIVTNFLSLHTYEEFFIIAKIYDNQAISYDELEFAGKIIDYYSFNLTEILVKNMEKNTKTNLDVSITDDFIITGSELEYISFLEKVKTHRLSFIPFKIIYAEGSISSGADGGGMIFRHIENIPVYATFSENENIMFYEKVHSSNNNTIRNYYRNDDKDIENEKFRYEEDDFYDDDDDKTSDSYEKVFNDYEYTDGADEYTLGIYPSYRFTNLKRTVGFFDYEIIIDNILESPDEYDTHYMRPMRIRPIDPGICVEEKYYTLVNNHIMILENHYPLIHERVKACNLYDSVKSLLNNMILPNRQSISIDSFCGKETTHGHLSANVIYGFLRMDV